jgi:diguanylate cyclase (GGDEF)-like protein
VRHGAERAMSRTGVSAGAAVEDKVFQASDESPLNSPRSLPSGEEARNAEALLALDIEAGSDYLLELIVHNLQQLGQAPHEAFLQRLLRGLTSIEVSEKESIVHWERILARRNELAEKLGRQVFLRTAAVDYFGELHLLRKPILLEYEELEKLRHNAATDPLTGLKNRRTFEEHLGREINRSRRYGASFAMLLLDLRRFKRANDTYGHAVGDEILRSVARASAETIRGSDISCRIGGDEFAILLPQADRSSAEAFAERIARKFESYARPLAPETPVGVDYGIAIFPEDGEEAPKLFQTADKNLYETKQKASRVSEEIAPAVSGSSAESGGPLPQPAGAAHPAGEDFSDRSHWLPSYMVAAQGAPHPHGLPNRRRDERIPVEGARRVGLVRLQERSRFVTVLDISRGGVGLLIEDFEVPESFSALIQVPFLPDSELTLYRVYSGPVRNGKKRVGCSFTPLSRQAVA